MMATHHRFCVHHGRAIPCVVVIIGLIMASRFLYYLAAEPWLMDKSSVSDRVIVVGAGPVGLTCAAVLARAGIPVLLARSNLGARA
ncbi:MAG: hypothetical protein FJ178_07635 [Gammaproteobacteria bacterium]|nr:hypothetical protein [Gammaproteobacteria bacterium]